MLIETLNKLMITETMPAEQQVEASRKICNEYIDSIHFFNVIKLIVRAAEREGGIQNIKMCASKKRFRDSICENMFWYNNNEDSTKIIKMEK